MIDIFKNDYYWMTREQKVYFPWIQKQPYRLMRHIFNNNTAKCFHCDKRWNPYEIVQVLIETPIFQNELFDLIFKSLLRSEIRFSSRFLPQKSNEERLTGNLISEIDNSLFITKPLFLKKSKERYGYEKDVDFFYYDLSRGGKVEKNTGADFGLILYVDLPDFPKTIKSIVFQAKKVNNSSSIDKIQYEAITRNDKSICSYLFYDMNMNTLSSPFVVDANSYLMKSKYEECLKGKHDSFSIRQGEIFDEGHPLSLFILSHLLFDVDTGNTHNTFESALDYFIDISNNKNGYDFNGRIGIASIGRGIRYYHENGESYTISISE